MNTGVGSLSFLQGIFLIQELNWGLLHCRQILYSWTTSWWYQLNYSWWYQLMSSPFFFWTVYHRIYYNGFLFESKHLKIWFLFKEFEVSYFTSSTQANQRFYSSQFFFFFFDVFTLLYLFIWFLYFWLGWVFSATCGLSLVVGSRNYSSCSAQASHCSGFSYCRAQALGTWDLWLLALLRVSTDVVHRLSYSVVCGSSWTRNCIVPCNGRQIPIHCTTWSLPQNIL